MEKKEAFHQSGIMHGSILSLSKEAEKLQTLLGLSDGTAPAIAVEYSNNTTLTVKGGSEDQE
eukprot:CAMPEP_0170482894 /NCGR_PEP_ID=MMETSP0208-20121228/2709_1 /TAXON_ID=197538 /ORGANISM="Strombidium inclinatum, Strain S3" /LENGTH=61 /DNA_ID=CAMNT_0010755779 /DNA_START=95 /DNA_END=277 /DNA_ORIENTATION=-